MNSQTINVKFDPKSLPKWAQNDPAVVAKCEKDYAYRCNVFDAKTTQIKQLLKKQAK